MLPVIFLSHGSPMTAITDSPARRFLQQLGGTLPRPAAILVASAHWETASPRFSAPARNETIHDFYGFPDALYGLSYTAPPAPAVAARAAGLAKAAGLKAAVDTSRGLDHGAWLPLLLAWPEADIPVAQVSVQSALGPAHHLALGAALAPLRNENVLIIGSGSFTHDLRRFRRNVDIAAPETADVTAFAQWMDAAIMAGDWPALADYRARAPFAAEEHPTEEHLLPLHLAAGAAGAGAKAKRLHRSVEFGFLRMDAYQFG
ncbi:dioxygenase [Acidocella sp.]|uniref:dioxygenase family protein n=1 Tax=Acidocella sp. TaxID=50710 RepID=UPI002603269E|nr:class III extradiol ring-cleavage dioxygenase [Acidocella sp.]